jgi:hypothetical protein
VRPSKILAARRLARGQSHDTHILDRVHFFKRSETFFSMKPLGQGALWSAPVNTASEEAGCVDPV